MSELRFNIPRLTPWLYGRGFVLTPWLHPSGLVHLCVKQQYTFAAQLRWITVCLAHEIDLLDFVAEDGETPTCVRCIAGTSR